MSSSNSPDNLSPPRILLLVSGSIAAFKAVALCSKLVQAGFDVEVALSENGAHFIGPASFEGLTRKKIHRENFEAGTMMAHIDLERSCDLIVNYPSTATTISNYVHGNGSSLLGAIFLAHEFKKPFWVAPAMNQGMMANPATQENLNRLESWGIRLLLGDAGSLACGETGAGRLMEPETVLEKIHDFFGKTHTQKNFLITAGGTREPIDPVRSITNFSTGETGYRIAKHLQSFGHNVTLLQSKRSSFSSGIKNLITFDTTEEFGTAFETQLRTQEFDTLIHSAAVADYSVQTVTSSTGSSVSRTSKIQGDGNLVVTLKPNPKWIQHAREFSKNKKIKLISFKLTSGESDKKLETYDSEYIFHNELSDVSSLKHVGTLYKRSVDGQYQIDQTIQTKDELIKLISQRAEA